jgi:hypothetical protein
MRARVAPLLAHLAVPSIARADYGDLPEQNAQPEPVVPESATPSASSGKSGLDFEIAALGDFLAGPIRGGTNPFGLGFGGRAGLVASHVYVGFTIAQYLGGSDVTQSDSSLLAGAEVGWGFVLHQSTRWRVELRPVIGVGNAAISHTDQSAVTNATVDVVTTASGRTVTTRNAPSPTLTINNLYVRPPLALLLQHDWQLVALEANGLVIPGIAYGGADATTWLSYGVQLQVGARF